MPIEVACGTCGATYTLRDEFGGQKLRCKQCESVVVVPAAPVAEVGMPPVVDRGYAAAFARDKFFVNQKRMTVGEKYYVFDEQQQPILFVERPLHFWQGCGAVLAAVAVFLVGGFVSAMLGVAIDQQAPGSVAGGLAAMLGVAATIVLTLAVGIALSPKRHITVYADESRSEALLKVYQDRKFNVIRATYTIESPDQGVMGRLMKNYLYNLFRKRWYVLDGDGTVRFVAKEDSLILSLLRRLLGPMFGILRTNYVVMVPESEQVIGEFNRKFTLFDRYVLDMSADRGHALDRRMALALAVLLDTGERR